MTQELDEMDPHKFRSELVKCLADYYENVRYMEGAGGLHCVKSFKRKFKDIAPLTMDNIEASSLQAADAEDGEGTGDDAQSAGAAAPAVSPAAEPADTAPPAKKAPATRGKGAGR